MLEDKIVYYLSKFPADQYSLYRKAGDVSMSQVAKALSALQERNIIHIARYRKSHRTGLKVPIYSLSHNDESNRNGTDERKRRLDIHDLLVGVTSERIVEYEFIARNLEFPKGLLNIVEIGSGGSKLAEAISDYSRGKWNVFGIDIAESASDIRMDARMMGFRNETFDQVICASTIEHIGIDIHVGRGRGDVEVIKEVLRILKKGGSLIITFPYGKLNSPSHRVYDRESLMELLNIDEKFVLAKKEFYRHTGAGWRRCREDVANRLINSYVQTPLRFDSAICACVLLRKR
ncbi:MAG TPA: class I SAM-dependent methyltransferase [Nitrososphaera sp.]